MQDKVFCPHCGDERGYKIWTGYIHAVDGDRHIGYFERTALCEECGNELDVPWIIEDNRERREKAYAGTAV